MVAVIETGGKQYCVEPGQKVKIERLTANVGETVTFANLLGGNEVTAEVLSHAFAKKVVTRKFRNKTREHKVKGHRQQLTVIRVAEGATKTSAKKTTEEA